ncbi:hypothetical protein J2801_004178 [Paraburkholderia phenoliruptrix]|nr:hypothetical protein [Paraburkholderia phenoliruptrix]
MAIVPFLLNKESREFPAAPYGNKSARRAA